jgi:ketosteroid isomerase-like protein
MGLATGPSDTIGVARRLLEAFSKGETAAVEAVLDADVKARPGIDGVPVLEGRGAVMAWWADFARRGAELEARPLEFELHGEFVVVRGYLRQRDGRTLAENQVFWLYEVRNGLITRMESHPSRSAALEALETAFR